jgi:hypothetical protein
LTGIATALLLVSLILSPTSSVGGVSCFDATSENIGDHLHPDPAYPLVGFWKDHCEDDFGLAIDRAGEGLYSISFCGPGGCFAPGTYRSNSRIVGDPDYRLVNRNTLEVLGRDGFSTYFRCTAVKGTPGV